MADDPIDTLEAASRSAMNPERWRRLMAALNAPESRDVFDDLVAAYSERHRHYHTAAHIADRLVQLDGAAPLMKMPAEVELALWFHDAIIVPREAGNLRHGILQEPL